MINVAIFISGRTFGYKECLLSFIQKINRQKYNIHLFFSINSFSFGSHENINNILLDIQNLFQGVIANIHIEPYKLPKSFVDNRVKNGTYTFHYNQLSCFYNDAKNMEMIENYEIKNNIKFDVICKTRCDLFLHNPFLEFVVDNPQELIIHNKHVQDISHWGLSDTPLMISDAFAYGNKRSMQIYCSTHKWILENDYLMKGKYCQTFEIYLTDSIIKHIFYTEPGGGQTAMMTKNEIIAKYRDSGIEIITENSIVYQLIPMHIRQKNNFVVDRNNVYKYTQI